MTPIIAYKAISSTSFCNSVSPACTTTDGGDLLSWLLFSHTTTCATCIKVAWDLDGFVALILSHIPDSARQSLIRDKRVRHGAYRLFYIPSKVFSINKNGSECSFYDLSQYFPGEPEPESISGIQEKADSLSSALEGLGITSPTTLASPVAVAGASAVLRQYDTTIPTVFDAPEPHLDAYELALQCTPREWVSNYQVGRWEQGELYSYDISSAYPYHASQLIDLRDCEFHRSTTMDSTAYYGFLVGDFTVYPDHPLAYCSPFITDRGDGTPVNFVGTAYDYPCLLDEVRTLYRHGMGDFNLKHGWFVKPYNGVRISFPLQKLMAGLYASRSQSELTSYISKRIMNGLIGKMLETRKDAGGNVTGYGELYNPIYHSICTTRTRLQVFDFITQHGISRPELVFIGVDGVKATRYIPLPNQAPMGKWRCSGSESAVVLSPGAVITPSRNFKRVGYAELMAECYARPSASRLGVNKSDLIDLRRLWVNQTRVFEGLPKTARELVSSRFLSNTTEM
ncbi:MAG: hypothetical protein PHQ43_00845 [Dehalococcoidales bacterium]|nr:hypothetical protein [Dehalococcoidales bacterium]